MIVKGNQRGGARQLAAHLLKDENEHIDVHELRGFMADDLRGAFAEAHAIAKGTNCKQFLFSMSLNPPSYEAVSTDSFVKAADAAEKRLGLEGQPRAIVFHEKEGRRHAHVVWSRIDPENMTAINLPWYKNKLSGLSRELYLEHGWDMPPGLRDPLLRNPLNFTQAEWQQALRTDRDPREIKQAIQDAWDQSDGVKAFRAALGERGFTLARGDRRGFVVIDYTGEVYSLARWAGVRSKEVKERLGRPNRLPGVDQVRKQLKQRMRPRLKKLIREQKAEHAREREPLTRAKREMAETHGRERTQLEKALAARWARETEERQARLHKGLKGVWDWLSGRAKQIREQNRMEAWEALKRDQNERDSLIAGQLDERRALQQDILELRERQRDERADLAADIGAAVKLEGRKAAYQKRMRRSAEQEREQERKRRRPGPGR